jgi:8-oxo-dGTP pyrophosphatase MutT (NUDIX family)
MSDARVRQASTVVLLRPSARRFDVFLVRRHDNVAFMGGAHVFPGGRVEDVDREGSTTDLDAHRRAAVRELAEEAGVVIPLDALTPFDRWITPEIEIKRFDAMFFLALLPPGQEAAHGGGETSDGIWIDPADAVAEGRRGAIALPPPTWTTLRTLESFSTTDAALAWARSRQVIPVRPSFSSRDGVSTLTLPEGTAAETTFVLENGRWKAQPS